MELASDNEGVRLHLNHEEALRLVWALRAGLETTSRAEYFIRHGLSRPNVEMVARHVETAAKERTGYVVVPLEAGVETVENPRRPRE